MRIPAIPRPHLTAARVAKGETCRSFGTKIGKNEMHVRGVEYGRCSPTVEVAARWADALGMDPAVAFPEYFSQPAAASAK